MVAALTYVGVSVAVLSLLTVVYVIEDVHGKRVFLTSAREALDRLFASVAKLLERVSRFFTHGFVRLLLHYGAHTLLKRILSTLRTWEHKVEELVRHNRKVAKDIRSQKVGGHLDAIAKHKEEVALSEEEKIERKAQ